MVEIQPPNRVEGHYNSWPTLFLGGSIEMDTAERWQDRLKADLADVDVVALNPRRDDWDVAIEQSILDPRFNEQVNWELDHLEMADVVAFYFDPSTRSPITLMELGLMAGMQRYREYATADNVSIVVCCPPGFWRRGNVEVLCARSHIPLFDTYDAFVKHLRYRIERVTGDPWNTQA